jgi:hypothetical protein
VSRRLRIALIASVLVTSACSSTPGSQDSDACSRLMSTPAEVLTQAELGEVPEEDATLSVDLYSISQSAVRVRVRVGGRLALHVELPSTAGCSDGPVFSHSYRLRPGPVDVVADTSQGQHEVVSLTLSDQEQWVVLSVQDGFPLNLEAWHREPGWG